MAQPMRTRNGYVRLGQLTTQGAQADVAALLRAKQSGLYHQQIDRRTRRNRKVTDPHRCAKHAGFAQNLKRGACFGAHGICHPRQSRGVLRAVHVAHQPSRRAMRKTDVPALRE